ncbi:MAG: PAS domain S-box protein, partial [Deltaproteobacteria bacterium]
MPTTPKLLTTYSTSFILLLCLLFFTATSGYSGTESNSQAAARITAVVGMVLIFIVAGMASWRYRSIVRLNNSLRRSIAERTLVEAKLRENKTILHDQNDQLLATEEMLRAQIEEYETSQKQLKESNQNLQTLCDVAPLSIVIASYPDGVIRKVNRTFTDDFGYQHDTVIGKSCIEVGIWHDPDERQRFLTILQEQQGVYGFSAEIRTFEGKSRTVLLYSNFVNYSAEHCIFSLFLDVTEQKLMEDQLRQTQKMDVIGQLAGGVAHDFNNMLTAIIGSAELMERHVKHAPAPMKLLGNILEASARSADLTQQLLAFSRKEQKNCTQVCINKTINAVISLLERTVDKNI